jgi:uncharacterized protein YbjQ (UPF0145 family)
VKLSAADHQALRSAGFTPAGRVFGNHVRRSAAGKLACGTTVRSARPQERMLASAVGQAMDQLRRMASDADGVIGIRVVEKPMFGRVTEVSVTGVAVRADGDVRPPEPFLSDLNGRDFAKLLHTGWVPCGLALGIAAVVAHHFELPRTVETTLTNRELVLPSAIVRDVQRRARTFLGADCARLGGEGAVLGQMTVRVREPHCWMSRMGLHAELPEPGPQPPSLTPSLVGGELELHGRDLYAEAVFTATAITQFRAANRAPLVIMPVSR